MYSAYNTALWPAQVVLLALALALALALIAIEPVMFPRSGSGVAVSALLSALWVWLARAYHLTFLTAISPLASAYAVLSLAGAGVFFWRGVVGGKLEFGLLPGSRRS